MKIGVLVDLSENVREAIEKAASLGFESCQLACWKPELFTDENAEIIILRQRSTMLKYQLFGADGAVPPYGIFTTAPLRSGLFRRTTAMRE